MRVIVIGAGRIGSALAHRSVALGHDTHVLCRSLRSRSIRPMPPKAVLEPIASAAGDGCDLVLVAAPAWADPRKEALIRSFLSQVDTNIPICSVTAYPGSPTLDWAPGHPFLRFMCSPAIANANYKPLVITCLTNQRARVAFEKWLGPAELHDVPARDFARLLALFLAAAIHCETLRELTSSLRPSANNYETRFAGATLLEAFALLELHGFDATSALAACLTPRGITKQAILDFRNVHPALANQKTKN